MQIHLFLASNQFPVCNKWNFKIHVWRETSPLTNMLYFPDNKTFIPPFFIIFRAEKKGYGVLFNRNIFIVCQWAFELNKGLLRKYALLFGELTRMDLSSRSTVRRNTFLEASKSINNSGRDISGIFNFLARRQMKPIIRP